MSDRREILVLSLGIFITIIVSATAFVANPANWSKWSSYGWGSLMLNIIICVVAILLALGSIPLVLKMIRSIDKEAEERSQKMNEQRDRRLFDAFKSALEENNIKLAETLKDVLGK